MNLFNRSEKEKRVEGAIAYLDGSALARPAFLPRKALPIVGIFVIVAAVIGVFLFTYVNDNFIHAATKERAGVEENLAREVSIDLPNLAQLMALDDASIQQSFTDAGLTTMVTSQEGDYPEGGFELVKLPSDVTLAEAGILYMEGISNISTSDAARLLNGSWTLDVNRKDGLTARVRYADFTSGSIDAAIQNAMVAEGLDSSTLGDAGVDSAGNTYQSGTVEVDGTTYTWRVSALPLSNVYKVNGFPETAVYVGIRFTA